MKRNSRSLALLLAVMVLAVSMLTSCSSAPTAEDAKKYVQAVLDLMCTGDYDHSVKLADIEEGKETEMRDQMIDEALGELEGGVVLSDEVRGEFKDVLIEAFSKAKYTVGDAVKTDDGGYDVTVTVEPLKVFAGIQTRMQEESATLFEDLDPATITEDEINNRVYSLMARLIKENLQNPTYEEGKDVVVHYGLLDEKEKIYGISEEDGTKLGSLLFSQSME